MQIDDTPGPILFPSKLHAISFQISAYKTLYIIQYVVVFIVLYAQ